MKKLLVVFSAACIAQTAIAAGPGDAVSTGKSVKSPEQAAANTQEVGKAATTFASSVSAPVRLTDAEMDKVVAGGIFLYLPSASYNNAAGKLLINPLNGGGPKERDPIITRGASVVFY